MNTRALYQSVSEAAEAFEEPLESPVFNAWQLEKVLEFLERTLRKRKAGLREIYDSGLSDLLLQEEDTVGFENWSAATRRTLFIIAREFGHLFSRILDKVERDPEKIGPELLRCFLLAWKERLGFHLKLQST